MRTYRWPIVALVALLLVAGLVWRACRTVERVQQAPADALREAGRAAAEVAARFKTGKITTTFVAALPQLAPGGPNLELATLEATETIRRTDERAVFFDLVPLGTNVTEIRVPATYRYHVRLSDPWRLDVRERLCLVHAPRLRPSQPPAIHTDRMEKRSERGWARWDVEQQMEQLERSITPTLVQRAAGPQMLGLVREPCRQKLAEFVRTWLLREEQWRDGRFTAVTVVFDGEAAGGDGAARPPTLVLTPGEGGTDSEATGGNPTPQTSPTER